MSIIGKWRFGDKSEWRKWILFDSKLIKMSERVGKIELWDSGLIANIGKLTGMFSQIFLEENPSSFGRLSVWQPWKSTFLLKVLMWNFKKSFFTADLRNFLEKTCTFRNWFHVPLKGIKKLFSALHLNLLELVFGRILKKTSFKIPWNILHKSQIISNRLLVESQSLHAIILYIILNETKK